MPKKVLSPYRRRRSLRGAAYAPRPLEPRGSDTIDVSQLVGAFKLYVPLCDDPDLFRAVRVGEHGTDIVWTDTIEMSNDTLWRLAQEQSGATMTADGVSAKASRPTPRRERWASAGARLPITIKARSQFPVALATRALERAS